MVGLRLLLRGNIHIINRWLRQNTIGMVSTIVQHMWILRQRRWGMGDGDGIRNTMSGGCFWELRRRKCTSTVAGESASCISPSTLEGSADPYWTSWPHIEQISLWLGNAWEMIALFDTSDASVISSRRYPGYWCRLCISLPSIGDVMWRSRGLDEDSRKWSRQISKRRLIDSRLWIFAPRSSYHTSRRGGRHDFDFSVEFEGFDISSLSETFEVPSAYSKGALGKPSLSYTSKFRSRESSVEFNIYIEWEVDLVLAK